MPAVSASASSGGGGGGRKTPLAVISARATRSQQQQVKQSSSSFPSATEGTVASVVSNKQSSTTTTSTISSKMTANSVSATSAKTTAAAGPEEPSIPMVRWEKLESHQRFYSNLSALYANGREFQIEEIRARTWQQQQERLAEKQRTLRLEQEVEQLKQQLRDLQAALGRRPMVPRSPLNTEDTTGKRKARDPDQQIVAALVSGDEPVVQQQQQQPPAEPFAIYEDETTINEPTAGAPIAQKPLPQSAVAPLKQKDPDFEIYTDEPSNQVTESVIASKATKAQSVLRPVAPAVVTPAVSHPVSVTASFQIFEDEPSCPVSAEVPVPAVLKSVKNPLQQITVPPPPVAAAEVTGSSTRNQTVSPADDDDDEELVDRMDTLSDFSLNPIAAGRKSSCIGVDYTFILPSETEFRSKAMTCSTPAFENSLGVKKHVSRIKAPAVAKVTKSTGDKPVTEDREEDHPVSHTAPSSSQHQQTQNKTTGKLDTIVETSREYKSSVSSSSGSSAGHTTRAATITRTRFLSGPASECFLDNRLIISDPFDVKLIQDLMEQLEEPIERRKGFKMIRKNLPKIKESLTKLPLGTGDPVDKYIIQELKDEGAYAKVYTAQIEYGGDNDENTGHTNNNTAISDIEFNRFFALKVSRPANMWEFYIVDEVQKRLSQTVGVDIELSVQTGSPAVLYSDASVLVDEYCPNGTLMSLVNSYKKKNKSFPKSMAVYLALELMLVIQRLHQSCEILHSDVKPDNVLILNFPTKEEVIAVVRRTSAVKLIDFGRAIDLSLFPKGTMFTHVVETKGSATPEMMDGKPWSRHIDWFGFCDCVHVMLFQDYIHVTKDNESKRWTLVRKVNKRMHLQEIWEPMFDQLLNLPSASVTATTTTNALTPGRGTRAGDQEVDMEMERQIGDSIDQWIAVLTAFSKDHLGDIYKESMEMETFYERSS